MKISISKLGSAAIGAALFVVPVIALADTVTSNFENPPYTLGNINGQDGWTKTGPYDVAVATNTYGFPSFGAQSLRVSNSVTSGSFGDHAFSKSLLNEAGEADSTSGGMSGGVRQAHFEAQFDFGSTMLAQQPGLTTSVSPDRGDGSRMSFLRFEDGVAGINVVFFDVQGENAGFQVANFVATQVATGLSRSVVHTAKFSIDYFNGPSNDVVKIYIDGILVHTGTTWENYYRFDTEAAAEQTPRTTDSLIFRTGGVAVPGNAGNGFIFDNLSLLTGSIVVGPPTDMDQCKNGGWETFNNPSFNNQGQCVSFVVRRDYRADRGDSDQSNNGRGERGTRQTHEHEDDHQDS